jgi:hypothetical protein
MACRTLTRCRHHRCPAASPLAGPAVSPTLQHGALAQLAEQRTFNPRVPGSIPGRPTQLGDLSPGAGAHGAVPPFGNTGRAYLHAKQRLPEPVEVSTYYVVSEGLTNVAKHARASMVTVQLDTHDTIVRLAIGDDGIGGADPDRGSGLLGLRDRIEALGGTLEITSPAGKGTRLLIGIPLHDRSTEAPPEP